MNVNPFKKVSQAPTNPAAKGAAKRFDVADLYEGPVAMSSPSADDGVQLDEKLRQAYFWIVNNAIISPHYDIEYNAGPSVSMVFGDSKTRVNLPSGQSYSSFVLIPLLTFATQRRCLLIGGPGRGKTSSAVLMGVLAGYSVRELRRAMVHGQPQMTVADLLGNPMPADLINAKKMEDINIAWRSWLPMRIKIIDEYNRIPTRTQSALLTVMSDNYAELLNHIQECPPAAWYLTANDDTGGGTYAVIEALRDRIDVVVKSLHFNSRFLNELLTRIEEKIEPAEVVPQQLIFTKDQTSRMNNEILGVELEVPLRRRLEFFASQFEFFEPGGDQVEYKTKDTARLSGMDYHSLTGRDTGKDRLKDIGAQTRNGLSVRSLMSAMVFAKALAYFRGNPSAELEDLRQILPFVLYDKLIPDSDCPFFDAAGNEVLRVDRVAWIRRMFDMACAEYDRLNLDKDDPVAELDAEFAKGLSGVTEAEARSRLIRIERVLNSWTKGRKLYGHVFDDLLKLKYLHQRYTNYLAWLEWNSRKIASKDGGRGA